MFPKHGINGTIIHTVWIKDFSKFTSLSIHTCSNHVLTLEAIFTEEDFSTLSSIYSNYLFIVILCCLCKFLFFHPVALIPCVQITSSSGKHQYVWWCQCWGELIGMGGFHPHSCSLTFKKSPWFYQTMEQ